MQRRLSVLALAEILLVGGTLAAAEMESRALAGSGLLAVAITDPIEGSICTGSTFFHEEMYYAFYAVRMSDGSAAQLCAATSRSGIHFKKQPPLLARPAVVPLPEQFRGLPGRDVLDFTAEQASNCQDQAWCVAPTDRVSQQ